MSNSETNEVFVIDVGAGSVKKKIAVGAEPQGVAVRPDGKVVYVATHGADEVSAIDPKTVTLLGRIDAGVAPAGHPVRAHAARPAFVIDEGVPTITIVDTKQNTFKEQFVIPALAKTTPPPALQSAVFSPDGKQLYVTTGRRAVRADRRSGEEGRGRRRSTASAAFPRGIAISADGKKLYTANGASNDVAIIDIASKKVEARVAVPGAPWGVVLLP